jgi:hypothetical protein
LNLLRVKALMSVRMSESGLRQAVTIHTDSQFAERAVARQD